MTTSEPAPPADRRQRGHWSRRTKARKAALDVLFESDLRGVDPLTTLEAYLATPVVAVDGEAGTRPVRDYTEQLVRGVEAHRHQIDARIEEALDDGWTLTRMPRVDRALARIAVYEMDHGGIAPRIAIAEALILAGDLSTDESPAFLNGVLSAVARTAPLDEDTVVQVHQDESRRESETDELGPASN